MPLEPHHELAIDLLVAGHRQIDVAAILKISDRTLRRWGENEEFVGELSRQHKLARRLQQDEAAEIARENREQRLLKKKRVTGILQDPHASPLLLIESLKLVQHDEQHERRLDYAQAWRAFVYHDQKRERVEREEAERKVRAEFMAQTQTLLPTGDLLAQIQAAKDERYKKRMAQLDQLEAQQNAEKAARTAAKLKKADKTGHPPTPGSIEKADQSGQARAVCGPDGSPAVTAENPDKSGHPTGSPSASPGFTDPLPLIAATHKSPDKTGHAPLQAPSVAQFVNTLRRPPTVKVQPVPPFRYATEK